MDTPKLTIGDLLKIGLLTDARAFKYVVAGDTTFLLTWYGRDYSLKTAWLSYNAPFKAFVEIVWERRGKIERPFFRCANTGKICSTLYFNGADWAHRTDTTIKQNRRPRPLRDVLEGRHDRLRMRLLGEDGRGPPRTRRRLEIVAHFKNHPHYVADHPDLRRAMEAIEARALLKLRPIARSSQTDSPLSTRAGLIDAQEYGVPALKLYEKETNYRRASMANYPMAQIMGKEAAAAFNRPSKYPVSRYYDWVSRIAPPKIRSKKAAIKFVEDTPSLECQVLMELVDEKPEGRYGFCLHWKTNTLDLRFSGILAVKGRESEWVYIQRDGTNGVMDRQSIRVVSNSTGKRLFVCPFTNKASARLFYRDGCFASRTAQRLVNLSQRKRQVPRRPKLAPFF